MKKISFIQPDAAGWLQKFQFSIPIKVRYCETDMLGHVNNVSYFMYFEQGRVDYFDHLGLTAALFGDRFVAVTADLECQYLEQVYLKDPLQLYVRTARIGRSSVDIQYALVANGRLKAAGRGALVLIDKESGKSAPLPDFAREMIRNYEGDRLEE